MKVLVLGGGYCQLNMIKRLKSRGDYIILADYLADNPGKEYVDEHHMISTFDEPAVTQLAMESGAEAVMTMGTDQPVLTAALAGEKCGLPFYVDSKTAETVTNKRVMKKLFSKNGIPTNAYRLVGKNFHDREIIGLRFPAVLKPVDSQGQRGIFKITDLADIRRHIDETLSFSREGKALLEEYYPNDEITVNGWVNEGKAHIVSVVDRVTMEIGNRIGICICHNYPSLHHTHYKEEINGLTQKIIDVFNIKTGPLYFQYFIGEKSLIVNEIAMRIGGAYEDITIPIISGFDILGKVMDYAETGTSNVPEIIKYD
ncbi:MAG: ATP-grasp domain-containing protein, partial [Clostridia bacterium]|nr:ATP-grasp domain-containing protein [Clostridia bacterium]